MTLLIAAGGTGGHIVPALAVARAYRELHPEERIVFAGVGRELEMKLIEGAGYELRVIPFRPYLGGGLLGKLRLLASIPKALLKTTKLFREIRPSVVLGFGGYPSFMPMLYAWLTRVPRLLHEQNIQVGVANRVLSRLSNQVFALPSARGFPSGVTVARVPMPVRPEFLRLQNWKVPGPGERFTILVLGGSQGAVSVNNAILELVPLFKRHHLHVIHQAGATDLERVRAEYLHREFHDAEVVGFVPDLSLLLARSDLVISRAGAMAVAELTSAARPTIFIPLVVAAAHQSANVEELERDGGAIVLEQDGELVSRLGEIIASLVSEPKRLSELSERMRQKSTINGVAAAEIIARAVHVPKASG